MVGQIVDSWKGAVGEAATGLPYGGGVVGDYAGALSDARNKLRELQQYLGDAQSGALAPSIGQLERLYGDLDASTRAAVRAAASYSANRARDGARNGAIGFYKNNGLDEITVRVEQGNAGLLLFHIRGPWWGGRSYDITFEGAAPRSEYESVSLRILSTNIRPAPSGCRWNVVKGGTGGLNISCQPSMAPGPFVGVTAYRDK